MNKIRVVLLAGDGESTKLMFNGIKAEFFVQRVIIENSKSKVQLIRRRIVTLGVFKVVGQVFFMIYNLLWLQKQSKKRIIEIKQDKKLFDKKIDNDLILKVDTINCKEVADILQKINPDVVVVNGTRIISDKILNSIGVEFINTHVGITPNYRGVHGGYWALTECDKENCGVTIHLVDSGVDTGGILYQETIDISKSDTFNTYPYLQISLAIPLMKRAIKNVASQSYKIQVNNAPSKLWTHPTILEYFKYRYLHGVK